MGFMDNFTTDGMVEMKHTEYYNLMREAAKAELIEKAVKADVPGFYIQAMITGKKPEFPNKLEAEEKSTGFGAEYEQMTGGQFPFLKHGRKKTAWRVRRHLCTALLIPWHGTDWTN